jgi:seryl-tRNA synthetase
LFIKNKHQDAKAIKSEIQKIKDKINTLESEKVKLDEQFKLILLSIPNIPSKETPIGKDEKDNVEVRRWGDPHEFKFKPKAHWDLGVDLNLLDPERSVKQSGSRFNIYLGDGAKLIRVLQ